jgi:hypothetical protein
MDDKENDYLKIAQLYYQESREYSYYEIIKLHFNNMPTPSKIHQLLLEISPQYITTNWDTFHERAIEKWTFFMTW